MHWIDHLKSPPQKYGTVLFYWWNGEEITKEKLAYQLSVIKDYPVAAIQINYCHSYTGGNSYGLTYPGSPAIFSDAWWELVEWFTGECGKYGIKVSLSDYTLSGVGQGFYTDRILAESPQYRGKRLRCDRDENGELKVSVETVENSINPIKPGIGELVCKYFFEEFERKTRYKLGEDFDYFFSDELDFGIDGYLWDEEFEAAFEKEKGYAIKDYYRQLFFCEGDFVKVRTDYYDVMVLLMNRHYFRVIYDFHEKRGMTYGCDHGSRGLNPMEFGSYFSTQKYNQGPGCDQPKLQSDIIKNKVAASIANINQRPRVWLEGFYGSGWGTNTEQLTDAICRNFAMGHNLLALHGTYYTTLGGFWEWAPPCNLIRMPYREAMKDLLGAVRRMSYLLSRGYRYTKVAVHYPTASLQCGLGDGDVKEVFATAEYLYKNGIDFDFVDDEALLSGEIQDNGLKIGPNTYEFFVFPKETVMRPEIRSLLDQLERSGVTVFHGDGKEMICQILKTKCPDVSLLQPKGDIYISHRIFGEDHIYALYGAESGQKIRIAGTGYWYGVDLVSGEMYSLQAEIEQGSTIIHCPKINLPILVMICAAKPLKNVKSSHIMGEATVVSVLKDFDVEYESVLNNRYGDFSLPASNEALPMEVRTFGFVENEGEIPVESSTKVTCGVGAYYQYAISHSEEELEQLLVDAQKSKPTRFTDYAFSQRFGKPDDPGIQGYHGLKGVITDDFMVMGTQKETLLGYDYLDDGRNATVFLFDVLYLGESVQVAHGEMLPDQILVNGVETDCDQLTKALIPGKNRIVAVYRKIGRTHLYLYDGEAQQYDYPLAMSMYQRRPLPLKAQNEHPYQWLCFDAAPGLEELQIHAVCQPVVFVNDIPMPVKRVGEIYKCFLPNQPHSARICLRFAPGDMVGGGALLLAPVRQICGRGKVTCGDLSKCDGLRSYAGGVKYIARFDLSSTTDARYYLEADQVISAMRVVVNGQKAGTLFCPPWRLDITELLRNGENNVEMTVFNTLSNHYSTIPTRYHGQLEYGLLSPVRILETNNTG